MRISTARDTLAGVVTEGLRASVVSDKEPVFEFGICVGFSARSAQLACGGKAGGIFTRETGEDMEIVAERRPKCW